MNHRKSSLLLAGLTTAAIATPPSDSPFGASANGVSGQIRLRSEVLHKSMAEAAHSTTANGLRSRVSYAASPSPLTLGKIEFQDSRVLGSEHSSISNAANIDLSQAWASLSLPTPDSTSSLKFAFGRMGMSLGSGRFLSTLEWHPLARRFDGAALNLDAGGWNATGLGFVVSDSGKADQGQWLTGLYVSSPSFLEGKLQVDGGIFYDKSSNSTGVSLKDVTTLDLKISGKAGIFGWEHEELLQMGEIGTSSVMAFQTATRVSAALPAAKVSLGLDAMSGESKGDDITRYTPSWYFGHAYYGWMDYFLGNPTYGVVDLRLDADIPVGKVGVFKPQVHHFMPQQSEDAAGKSIDAYGQELDLEFHLKTFPKANIVFGAAAFLPGDGASMMGTSGLASADAKDAPSYYLYFMPVINF
ncbi:MAG: alginate export family protein [Fibrobacteria bacterium]|nr:alginate export family protein [Fibrobacteria bacterium]